MGLPGVAHGLLDAEPMKPQDTEMRRNAFKDLLAQEWEYSLRTRPVFASTVGDKRYNDRLDDVSLAAIEADLDQKRTYRARFRAIDATGFPEQEAIDRQLIVYNLQRDVDGARFKSWEMLVSQVNGIQIDAPQFPLLLPLDDEKDCDAYVKRLAALPRAFEQAIANMRAGIADKLMPPCFLLGKVVEQTHAIATTPPSSRPS